MYYLLVAVLEGSEVSVNLTFWNVDGVLSQVDLDAERPLVDLSQVTFFEPFALVYLGMYLRHFNGLGKTFRVSTPEVQEARQYLARVRFWQRFNFSVKTIKQLSLVRFTSSTSLNDIVDIEKTETIAEDVSEAILKVLHQNTVRVNRTLIAELVAELVDNFAQHSKTSLAACAMQYYPRLRRVVFAIGDCGVGIRASLSSNARYADLGQRPHHEAALRAFDPLVSRRPEGGTGLAEGVADEGGELVLATGDGYVRMIGGRTQIGYQNFDLPGVQIEISFPERRQ